MKPIDIAPNVMSKIAVLERNRIRSWVGRFALAVAVSLAGLSVVFVLIVRRLLDSRAFDLFELFTQDPEIVREFCADVFLTFMDELPENLMLLGAIILLLLAGIYIVTRNKRKIIRNKITKLEKYTNSSTIYNVEGVMNKTIIAIIVVVVLLAGVFLLLKRNNPEMKNVVQNTVPANTESDSASGESTGVKEDSVSMVSVVSQISLAVSAPLPGSTVTAAKISVKGKTLPNAEVYANEAEGVADASGNFSLSVNLDEGENSIIVTAVDQDGNVAEKEVTVTYDAGE